MRVVSLWGRCLHRSVTVLDSLLRMPRTLSTQERMASSTYGLECLAVLFGIGKFRKYIEHQEFIVETDNQALCCYGHTPGNWGRLPAG